MKGIPVPWDANGDLHSEKRYKEMLVRVRNYDSGLFCIETSLSGKDILDILSRNFELLSTLKMVWNGLPLPPPWSNEGRN